MKSRIHVVGDGATWIEKQSQEIFGKQSSYLLDFYHVSGYLAAASPSCGPLPEGCYKSWQKDLLEGRQDKVISHLQQHREGLDVAEEKAPVRTAHRYLANRHEQLDYASA